MESDFQTSFIPKKPLTEDKKNDNSPKGVSLVNIISTFVFFASICVFLGTLFYKNSIVSSINKKTAELENMKKNFEPKTINEIQSLAKRIKNANEILNQHITVSPIFETLQASTLRSIRYTKFNYSFISGSQKSKEVSVKMSGVAKTYTAIALQAEELAKNQYIKDPVFSNLNLDEKGNVSFDLIFSLDPKLISFDENIKNIQNMVENQNNSLENN